MTVSKDKIERTRNEIRTIMLSGGNDAATIRILSHADIASVLTPAQVIKGVEEAYLWKSQDKTSTFPLVFHEFEPGVADMDIKSGHVQPAGLFGLKLVSFFETNAAKHLPLLYGLVALFDDSTGKPLALLEGTHLTGLRTGAAAALGAKWLARETSRNFLIVGAGHQCIFQIAATVCALPNIDSIKIFDPLSFDNAQARAACIREDCFAVTGLKIPDSISISATENLQEAVGQSDIITTATPSRKPLIPDAWIKPGTHISCVGADMPGKQELDPHTLARARVFVDDLPQCIDVGEIQLAIETGVIKAEDIIGEIGSVIDRAVEGRQNENDITVFDTTGIALQDLVAAHAALTAAEEAGIGCIAAL